MLFSSCSSFSVSAYPCAGFITWRAGLLTFPSLLYLPDPFFFRAVANFSLFTLHSSLPRSVALYEQTSITGITAAGTVPDSHRIPLHQAASATRLPFPSAKLRISEQKNKLIPIYFHFRPEKIKFRPEKIIFRPTKKIFCPEKQNFKKSPSFSSFPYYLSLLLCFIFIGGMGETFFFSFRALIFDSFILLFSFFFGVLLKFI